MNMHRLVIVGEDNPYGRDPRFALYHLPRRASGNRLRLILGLTDVTYYRLNKINLCSGKWSIKEARSKVWGLCVTQDVVVMLGKKVKKAFGDGDPRISEMPFFSAESTGGAVVVSLPHPSGLNRLWSEPGVKQRTRELLKSVAPWEPWGEICD